MKILVFVKRVPSVQEEELRIVSDGKEVDLSKVPFKMNDWDNYALEEAVRTVEKLGGEVYAISIGNKDSDEVLRRSIAMGAKSGTLLESSDPLVDPSLRAEVAFNFIRKEGLDFDCIFAGVQAEDDQFSVFGGYLAALLGIPYVCMVINFEEWSNGYAILRRELEGGLLERLRVRLPALFSIQTGICEPRYVSVMGIKKASQVERKVYGVKSYLGHMEPKVELVKWVFPKKKEGAKILSQNLDEATKDLLAILREKGVLRWDTL